MPLITMARKAKRRKQTKNARKGVRRRRRSTGRRKTRRSSNSNIAQLTSNSGKTVTELVNELNNVTSRLGQILSNSVGAAQNVEQALPQSNLRRSFQEAA